MRTPTRRTGPTMSRQYFGTDGIRGTVGQAPITPDFMLRLGHAVGPRAAARRRAADGADRQGHAHLGLHDRVGARGRLRVGRRRRAAQRPAADARRGLPDARAAARPGRRHQRLAQSLRRQRHQVLLGPRREAARRLGAGGRGGAARGAAVGRLGRPGQGAPRSTTPAAATSSSARARFRTACRCAA